MRKSAWVTYGVSILGIALFLNHLWFGGTAAVILWSISTAFAIYCIYSGLIVRHLISTSNPESDAMKGHLTAAVVISCFVLFGIILSAIFLLQ